MLSLREKISFAVAGLSIAAVVGKSVWDSKLKIREEEEKEREEQRKKIGRENAEQRAKEREAHTAIPAEGNFI